MIEVSVLVDKINGMSCDELAGFFRQEQVVGEMSNEHACPIANWIRKESGCFVSVGQHAQQIEGEIQFAITTGDWDEMGDWEPKSWYIMGPGPASFIGSFDNGRYEDLVAGYEMFE